MKYRDMVNDSHLTDPPEVTPRCMRCGDELSEWDAMNNEDFCPHCRELWEEAERNNVQLPD